MCGRDMSPTEQQNCDHVGHDNDAIATSPSYSSRNHLHVYVSEIEILKKIAWCFETRQLALLEKKKCDNDRWLLSCEYF